MITYKLIPFRSRRRTEGAAAGPTPPSAPVLVSATIDTEAGLTLVFDIPVDFTSFSGSEITINDPVDGATFEVSGDPTIGPPNTMTMEIEPIAPSSGTQILLNASSGTGILSAVGALEWAGVSAFVVSQ